MKKTFIAVALLMVLGTMTIGCQKENLMNNEATASEIAATRTVVYTVNGKTQQITLVGDKAWHEFVNHLMALSREGNSVSFRDANAKQSASKETLTYTTADKDAAAAWCVDRYNEGYTVYMNYDEDLGVYVCTAIK